MQKGEGSGHAGLGCLTEASQKPRGDVGLDFVGLLGCILDLGAQVRSSPLRRSLLTAGGLCSAQPQACQVLPAHAGPPQSSLRLLCSHFMLQVAQSTEGREDRQFSALLGTGSMLPIFMKEVRCPQFSVPPRESLPARAGCLCVGRGGRVGGWGLTASHTADRSCLWTLKNPIFFLIATARALSPHSLLVLAGASPHLSPHCCLPLPTPRLTPPPLAVTRVGTHHISCLQPGGAGELAGPRPGLPDEIVLFQGG